MQKIYIAILAFILATGQRTTAQQVIILRDSTEIPELNLDEIEVSASKSSVSLKKMPATVNLVTASTISENEVQTLTDLSALTPGFFMPDYGSKLTSPLYIRGIGSRINSPSVGLYVDHVPYFEKAAYNFDFFDVERIEILKGPQGTLYGRNAMGGIVNVITRSPMRYQGTQAQFSAGAFGLLAGNIGHYTKLGSRAAASLTVNYLHRDGYYHNDFMDQQVDKIHSVGARSKLVWKPAERWEIENIFSFEYSHEGGYPYALLNDSLQVAEAINYNQPSSYTRSIFSDALVARYTGSAFEFQSVTAYQYLDDRQEIDQDFTADSSYFVLQEQGQHMVSQELILRSPRNKRYSWLFGVYGFMQQFDKQVDVEMYQRNMTALKHYNTGIGGAALFHQSSLQDFLIENLSLTAGIRLDYEKDVLDYLYDIDMAGTLMPMADTIYPHLSYTEVLPKVALNYKMTNSSVYAVVAKGYKTGGFNSTFYKDEDLFFQPEYSWSYEVGSKSVLFGSKVYADISLFYIDWRNQQIYQPAFYRDDTPAPGSLLKNAGHSSSKGGEITIKTIPLAGFTPVLSYGYTHATFTEHTVDETTDYSGNYIPYVPQHTLNASVKRFFFLESNNALDKIGVMVSYQGLGDIWWNEENSYKTGFYGLLNTKVSFHRDRLALELWGKNLLSAQYDAFYFQAIGNQYVQTGKPLRFGLNLKYEF